MATPEDIKQVIKELNPHAIFIKGFDNALYGTGRTIGGETVAVYCADDCLRALIKEHEMEELEALEHFEIVVNGMTHPHKPIFINNWRLTSSVDKILEDTDLRKIIEQFKNKKEENEQ